MKIWGTEIPLQPKLKHASTLGRQCASGLPVFAGAGCGARLLEVTGPRYLSLWDWMWAQARRGNESKIMKNKVSILFLGDNSQNVFVLCWRMCVVFELCIFGGSAEFQQTQGLKALSTCCLRLTGSEMMTSIPPPPSADLNESDSILCAPSWYLIVRNRLNLWQLSDQMMEDRPSDKHEWCNWMVPYQSDNFLTFWSWRKGTLHKTAIRSNRLVADTVQKWFLTHWLFETFGRERSCVIGQEPFFVVWEFISTTMRARTTGFVIAQL